MVHLRVESVMNDQVSTTAVDAPKLLASERRDDAGQQPYTCSCGVSCIGLTAIEDHLAEMDGNELDSNMEHVEIALPLDTLVMLGMRRIRIERGLTMRQMGDLLGVHLSAVSRIESGKRRAIGRGRTPRSVAAMLGVSVSELLRVCARCEYRPEPGYRCERCGLVSVR